jgi:hypothetical protein
MSMHIIKVSEDHNNPKDSQVFIAITGNKKAIREALTKVIEQMDDSYGKPIQGIHSQYGAVCTVITPLWEGIEY